MLNAFLNCFKIPELRQRILFTMVMIVFARIGANLPLPGINPIPLQNYYDSITSASGGIVGMYNMFTGGALLKGAIFALGIMPYISASIILQLMGAVIPSLSRIQREGEVGRQKIAQYTRYLTIIIALIQGLLLALALTQDPGKLLMGFDPLRFGSIVLMNETWFVINSTLFLTSGCVMLMWIGDQITQRGIGNGISLLISIGIVSDVPGALRLLVRLFDPAKDVDAGLNLPQGVLMLLLFLAVTSGIVAMTQALRRIPVQHARRVVGRKQMVGQSSYLPLKVNYSGVMPVIFASAILMFPQQIFATIAGWTGQEFFSDIARAFSPESIWYYFIYGGMILMFAYFWVSIMFKPQEVADQLKANNGYILGVRPGDATAQYLDHVMTRLTLAGALMLTAIAVFPMILTVNFGIPFTIAQFFGGTGTLIAVGVMLETMKQIETFLLPREYDGFLQKSKRRSRAQQKARRLVEPGDLASSNVSGLYMVCGSLVAVGLVTWVIRMITGN